MVLLNVCLLTNRNVITYREVTVSVNKSIAFKHGPQRVWQERVYCHAIKKAETTLTIKLQHRRAGGYKVNESFRPRAMSE